MQRSLGRVGEKSQDPLHETKIAPLVLDYKSATIKRQCLASINQSINHLFTHVMSSELKNLSKYVCTKNK